jgi:hypothetical protein
LATALTLALVGLPLGADAQTAADCVDPTEPTPEMFGPTDITATSGNQDLSVALNGDATVTVLKWPSPSFYDQIKYRTSSRTQPRMGALPNEGAFIGIAYRRSGAKAWRFSWLRSWRSRQSFYDADSDAIRTVFTNNKAGLQATVIDFVAHDRDALFRRVILDSFGGADVSAARIFSFANFNPVFSKSAQAPLDDWCTEEDNDDGVEFRANAGAIVASRSGIDTSTGDNSSAALAMRFVGATDGHSVGSDTYESPGGGQSAFDDSQDGKLSGGASVSGQSDAAIFDHVAFEFGTAVSDIVMGAGRTPGEALTVARGAAQRGFPKALAAKANWYERWLGDAPLPKNAPKAVVRLSKRALISLRQAIDANTSDVDPEGNVLPRGELMVASIATQSPYGLDWIRNGAYLNYALEIAGHPEVVNAHNFRYAVLQSETGDSTRGGQPVPPGNWAMNFYADGVVGGTIPYEIDETGYGIWALWEHYRVTKDEDYLNSDPIYEAIQRAAQYLTDTCRDPTNGLQCVANEGDDPSPSQTLRGAMLVWLGLDSAAKAARVRGTPEAIANATLWETRRDELAQAIEDEFFDAGCECYSQDFATGGTFLWPVGFLNYGTAQARAQADVNYAGIRPAIRGNADQGAYEARAILGNAYVWAGQPQKMKLLKEALVWLATEPTTNDTGILGEAWMRFPNDDSEIVTMVSQPHVPQQILFYLAALKVYGKTPYKFD